MKASEIKFGALYLIVLALVAAVGLAFGYFVIGKSILGKLFGLS